MFGLVTAVLLSGGYGSETETVPNYSGKHWVYVRIYIYIYMVYTHQKNATICKICAPLFRTTLLWFVREAPGYGIAAIFCQTCRDLANALHFRCRNPLIAALYKTAHCGAAIKVRQFWREKAARFMPFFQMLPRLIRCILFDAYRTCICTYCL